MICYEKVLVLLVLPPLNSVLINITVTYGLHP